MKILWLPNARAAVLATARYIRKEFGLSARLSFMNDVKKANDTLGDNPCIGKKEPLLEELNTEYRSYVLNKRNKIVYRIQKDCMVVYDFWDVRREPDKLKQTIKQNYNKNKS